jgi:hypothetical protein
MKGSPNNFNARPNRRSFVKAATATASVAGGLLANSLNLFGDEDDDFNGTLTKGDAAMLRFAAAAEILETDFWVQYNELGGIPDNEGSRRKW